MLRIVTWNILHEAPCEDEREHPWRLRRKAARQVLTELDPDIICLQEAYPAQTDFLMEAFPTHWTLGRDRHGGNDREGCPISYNTARFALHEWDQFWLAVTPDQPSALTWGNDVPRILTWAKLSDRATGTRFRIANAHLDHLVPTSRTKTAELIQKRLSDATLHEPTILVGDFNSPSWSKPHRILTRNEPRFHDTLRLAEHRTPWYAGTFHHFKAHAFIRVDWILTQPAIRTLNYTVIKNAPNNILPSDHFPVCVEFPIPFEPPHKTYPPPEAPHTDHTPTGHFTTSSSRS